MNIYEAVKCLSTISQKLINKEDPNHGLVSFVKKSGKICLAVSQDRFSCIIPIEIKNEMPENVEFNFDGKLLSKILNKHNSSETFIECLFNNENQPSCLNIKGNQTTNVSLPVNLPLRDIKSKKMSSFFCNIKRDSFVSVLKSTIFAGSEVDAERPYYYALFKFKDGNISCVCGNGSFFSFVEYSSVSDNLKEDYFIMPISYLNCLLNVLEECKDDAVKIGFDDNAVVFNSNELKFSVSLDRKCVAWPDISSIINRKTGHIIKVEKQKIKNIADNIDLSSDGYDSKNETLKCKINITNNSMSFFIDGSCKIQSSIDIVSDLDTSFVKSLTIDAACISMFLKAKLIQDSIFINIDDSHFKGRPSPLLIYSSSENFSYKSFFAVS